MARATATTRRHTTSPPLGSVFYASVTLCGLFVLWATLFTENLNAVTSTALNRVTGEFGWVYLVSSLGVLVFLIVLAAGRFGRIRLGADTDRPEFGTVSWLAMILAAVMGIGLVSYGVSEPISHFAEPPHGLAQPGSRHAAVVALQHSFFDWGLHAWAIFAVFGIALGYSTHRKGRKGLVSPMLRPVLGRRVDGPVGKAVDVLAIFATLFGTTTSLGLGALQINGGLSRVFGMPAGTGTQVLIIAVVTILFTISAITGLHRGVRFLSESSMGLAGLLFAFVLIAGPSAFVLNLFVESIGQYVGDFVPMSLRTGSSGELAWMQNWTYFMLAWWISWGAFVGVFLARISRGRTIREFVVAVIGVPSAVFFLWFSVFGGSAIFQDAFRGGHVAGAAAQDSNNAIFAMLEAFPWPTATSAVAMVLVLLFFVSGADANTFVLSMLSSDGETKPRAAVLALWGGLTGVTAIVLLVAGGLEALQQTVIITAAPFVVLMVGLAYSLWREVREDPLFRPEPEPARAEREAEKPVPTA
ncbi:choline/carnitine/betaine transport [Saccharopolyspora erythraea NRRL 2338]|uniref:Glycine betaine transporter n=2 Tax=Saccharopolyspora erythraea TaxID=1836 RepID=A4FIK1_SACEN|nr:BCCT family transporter [Saccharopolyspora erythraea]EQD87850.1 BCCT transporter [Saccharopolyspora erythraea D]PFG97552.1 choline/carnitine/betaine transport [Saccharopolyspora erythraea NRRL 2338]QRK87722.1 BCCT family transporter [Saccharopolyspora erythraea]CAM03876.1 glycine betaine transporter [Saccharopolyspora erythraea NRRL 2338]